MRRTVKQAKGGAKKALQQSSSPGSTWYGSGNDNALVLCEMTASWIVHEYLKVIRNDHSSLVIPSVSQQLPACLVQVWS